MSGRLRIEFPGAVYHVYARGNSRRAIFLDDADRLRFLEYMSRGAELHGLVYHSYCLMGNHFHLLLETPRGNLSEGMHWLDSCYAGHFNWAHEHSGHVFQGRFQSIVVQRENYLLELCRYIVLNPVRAGLVSDPGHYKWSSYQEIAGLPTANFGAVTAEWVLSHFGPDPREARSAYASFVMEGEGMPSPLDDVVAGTLLGDRAFRASIRDRILADHSIADIPPAQRDAFRLSLEELFPANSMRSREERNRRIRNACNDWLYTKREIAVWLGLSESAVGKIV